METMKLVDLFFRQNPNCVLIYDTDCSYNMFVVYDGKSKETWFTGKTISELFNEIAEQGFSV